MNPKKAALSRNEADSQVPDSAARQKLWALFCRQAKDYTLSDSDSLPAEVAQELFASILYTLRLFLNSRGEGLQTLALRDENAVFNEAVAYLEQEIEAAKALYAAVLRLTPMLGHQALRDTLGNIGIGLKRYDYRHFAHEPPCEIDYQLCLPVPDDVRGIGYVQAYLRRLMAESLLIRQFDEAACVSLLESRYPDYRGLLVNLYEPIMCRALGRVLAGQSLNPPALEAADLALLPSAPTETALREAGESLCQRLGLPPDCRPYLVNTAAELLPRYRAAQASGNLGNIF